ncbi:MAG: M12 family metallo-peptidase [Candidatus Aureabacteria bacterium]|nr:M12 family metallo-peptidase [Candidatus Auribacterota bacterium]
MPISVRLNLFENVCMTAILERVEPAVPRGRVWVGRIEGVEPSKVVLVTRDGIMIAHVKTPDGVYEVRYRGGGVHVVYQVDPCVSFPGEDTVRVDIPKGGSCTSAATADDGSTITILVVYTQTAREMNGGTAAIEAAINLEVAMTNDSYANSQVTQRLHLVHTAEVNYTESSHGDYDLANLQGGWIDDVHALRDTYKADLVSMFVWSMDVAGIGYLMDSVSSAFEAYAYSVVKLGGTDTNYAFAHELGHNMGCQHDRANVYGSHGAYPYSYGYQEPSGAFHTIMAYSYGCPGSCPVIAHFSNPAVYYDGRPTGVDYLAPDAADNARTLNMTASTVANFRNEGGGPTPIPVPGEFVSIALSSSTPGTGDFFSVSVVVQPIEQPFDAYGVIIARNGVIYSFSLNNPGGIFNGVRPLAKSIPRLSSRYEQELYMNPALPSGAGGSYTVIVGFVPAGKSPSMANMIPGYVDQETVTVR